MFHILWPQFPNLSSPCVLLLKSNEYAARNPDYTEQNAIHLFLLEKG